MTQSAQPFRRVVRHERPLRPKGPTLVAPLTPEDYRAWMDYLKCMMRHDLGQAELHSDRWERRKAAIVEEVEGQRGAADKIIVRSRCRDDSVMVDEMDAWSFFQRRSLMYAGIIQAEMAARLGGFGA